ncbi:helix-turn-helix transcriptional regulator [Micromonospora marina]|uniref:Predicted DNA-binding transcriptional regulator YafY, contains an HTH and WYL domains n=1 Tax=Micromonospora marina TaxID=307120 RepID=A0A1C4W8U9_9ACTN|nr:YafY family protein [Micromonospora marina]SCE92656.1 Predicted DNA-binding transcriptional regulator YafY, contains an HTH and WYL domains [Micromonospora marina]
MADVTQRMLALLSTLETGRAFTGAELAARLHVSPRTLRRDVERLRGYGYPVRTQPGPGGHYRLAAGRAMPPLVLEDDEAVATLVGLATLASTGSAGEGSLDDAAARAYGKVDQFLPKRLRPRAAALRSGLETGGYPVPSTSAEVVGVLADAIRRHEVVTFQYTGAAGPTSRRRVEPYRQVHQHMRWYLLAHDTDRDDWRVFRTDRLVDPQLTGQVFTPRPLPTDTALDYLRQGMGRSRQQVVLTVEAPPGTVADALRHQDVELEPLAGDRTRAVLLLDSWQWLVLNLAFLDADFTVEAPAEMRADCREFGARLRRAGRE